jgi:hypothetical protein
MQAFVAKTLQAHIEMMFSARRPRNLGAGKIERSFKQTGRRKTDIGKGEDRRGKDGITKNGIKKTGLRK